MLEDLGVITRTERTNWLCVVLGKTHAVRIGNYL